MRVGIEKRVPDSPGGRRPTVQVAEAGQDATAGGPLQEAPLQQIGFVDVLDGVGLLPDGHGQRGQTDRTPVELLQDEGQDLPIDPVETFVVHLEQSEGLVRHRGRDAPFMAHLREVAHPLEQTVGDPRRAARTQGQFVSPFGIDLDAQDIRRTGDDAGQLLDGVVVESVREAEAVAQRSGDEPGARGGPDQA